MNRAVARTRLICALDTKCPDRARTIVSQVSDHVGAFKFGLEFTLANGPARIRTVVEATQPVFLDLKLHDIPNTVVEAIHSIACVRPFLTTVHASGGARMMQEAVAAAREAGEERPAILAVTVLTSLDQDDLRSTGIGDSVSDQVSRTAELAQACGVDGVVCSPFEVARVRRQCGEGFIIVAPGVRMVSIAGDDQKRARGPGETIAAGADYIVVGRPITRSRNPAEAAEQVVDDIVAG